MNTARFIYLPLLPAQLAATPSEQIVYLSLSPACNQWISGTLAELVPEDDNENTQEVYVFLPNLHILSTQVSVPRKQQKHLAQILPFLCEDKLACDIEEVHLAAGHIEGEAVSVRAIQRTLLNAVLDKLDQQGIQPRGVYSDAEPLLQHRHVVTTDIAKTDDVNSSDVNSNKAMLWLLPNQYLLIDQQRTASLHPSQVTHLTALLQGPAPLEIWVYRHPGLDHTAINLLLEALRNGGCRLHEPSIPSSQNQPVQAHLLPAFTAQGFELTPEDYTNLLTGPYTPARQHSRKLNWQPLAWVASAFIGLNLLYLLASGVYFDQRAHRLQSGSEQLYRQYFPQDRRLVNIRAQTQAHLDKNQQGADAGFLHLLGQVLPGWEQHRDHLQLTSLRYQSQRRELLIDIESKTISQLDQLQQALGPSAELLSANEDKNNGARGRIKFQGVR